MKKIILIVLITIWVVLVLYSEIFGEEKIAIMNWKDIKNLRWCPDGNSIAFVATFVKYNPEKENPEKEFYSAGIGKVNIDGLSFQIIASSPWLLFLEIHKENDEEITRRQRIKNPEPTGPGGYRDPTPSPKAITPIPLFSQYTPFEWSSDGKKIIFAETETVVPPKVDGYIWSINADGTGLRPLLKIDAEHPLELNWSPYLQRLDNGKIALRACKRNTNEKVFQCFDPESGRIENRISLGVLWPPEDYILSPDGKKVLVLKVAKELRGRRGSDDIFVAILGARDTTNITNSGEIGECLSPVWSPDSKKIAFEFHPIEETRISRNYLNSIWVIDADGKNSRPITPSIKQRNEIRDEWDGWVKDTQPAWSPDGRKIAFIREYCQRINGKYKYSYSIEVTTIEGEDQKTVISCVRKE